MGWDIIKYREHGECFHDGILWILRHFLLAEARLMESAHLLAFIEGWNWLCPGVVTGTDFSKFVRDSPSRWRLLLDLFQRSGDRIASFGEAIPKDYLEAHARKDENDGHFTCDLPTKRLLTDLGRMSRLLSKHKPQAA